MNIFVRKYKDIELSDEMIISDPGYNNTANGQIFKTAKTKDGKHLFEVYVGFSLEGAYGIVPSFLSINLKGEDFDNTGLEYGSECFVDSGTMSIASKKYFDSKHKNDSVDEKWFNKEIANGVYAPHFTQDNKSFITPSGYGDGCYMTTFDEDENGLMNRLVIHFIAPEGYDDEYDMIGDIYPDNENAFLKFAEQYFYDCSYSQLFDNDYKLPSTYKELLSYAEDKFNTKVKIFKDTLNLSHINDCAFNRFKIKTCEDICMEAFNKAYPEMMYNIDLYLDYFDFDFLFWAKDKWDSNCDIRELFKLYITK